MSWVWERELHFTSEHQSLLHWLRVKLNFPGYTKKCLSTCLVQKLRTGSHSSTGNALAIVNSPTHYSVFGCHLHAILGMVPNGSFLCPLG